MKYEDTLMNPKVRYFWGERLSRFTINDMIRRVHGNLESMRHVCRAGVRMQYPEWDDEQVEAEVSRRGRNVEFLASFNEYFRYVREPETEVLGA